MAKSEEELRDDIDKLLDRKPELVPPPDGLWESIHATWTGLWTDWHGTWDERQASDVFPVSDLLSSEAQQKLVSDLVSIFQAHTATVAAEAREDENARWKVVAEEIVRKDGVYRAVNYLNKRAIELASLNTTHSEADEDGL